MELLKLQFAAEGKEEGLKEGEGIGLEKGKKVIAKAMLAEGFTVEQVMRLTGLGEKVVGKLGKKAKTK